MKDDQLDDLFRAGRRDWEGDPGQHRWDALAERLDSFDGRRQRNTRYLRAAAAVLLLGGLAAGFALFNRNPDETAHQARVSEKSISVPQAEPSPIGEPVTGNDAITALDDETAAFSGNSTETATPPESTRPALQEGETALTAAPASGRKDLPVNSNAAGYPPSTEQAAAETADAETEGAAADESMAIIRENTGNFGYQDMASGAEEEKAVSSGFRARRAGDMQMMESKSENPGLPASGQALTPALEVRWPGASKTPCAGTIVIVSGESFRVVSCGDDAESGSARPVAGTVLERLLNDGVRSRIESFVATHDCPDSPQLELLYGDAPGKALRLPLAPECLPDDIRQLIDETARLAQQSLR